MSAVLVGSLASSLGPPRPPILTPLHPTYTHLTPPHSPHCLQIGEEEERAKSEYKEERAEAKKKVQTDKAWEKTRDERVGSWRDFVGKKTKKTKTGGWVGGQPGSEGLGCKFGKGKCGCALGVGSI